MLSLNLSFEKALWSQGRVTASTIRPADCEGIPSGTGPLLSLHGRPHQGHTRSLSTQRLPPLQNGLPSQLHNVQAELNLPKCELSSLDSYQVIFSLAFAF